MKFFFTFFIFFVIIISTKLFLFNEEFLILISFLTFCFFIYENLNQSIYEYFYSKINSIKKYFLISIDNVNFQLIQKINLSKKIIIINNLLSLKNHYLTFSKFFLIKYLNYLNIRENLNFFKKLKEIRFIELSYYKLITLLLLKKVLEIVLINKFFKKNLKIKRFKTLNKINNINLIKKI